MDIMTLIGLGFTLGATCMVIFTNVFSNLLTNYLFPDGGKKIMQTIMRIVLQILDALWEVYLIVAILFNFVYWMGSGNNPIWSFAFGLSLANVAVYKVMTKVSDEYFERKSLEHLQKQIDMNYKFHQEQLTLQQEHNSKMFDILSKK